MGISIYKYVAPYTTIWWVLAIGYLYALADHMYMMCYPRSPPLPVFLTIYWIAISDGPTQAGAMFYKWKKMNDNDREFHTQIAWKKLRKEHEINGRGKRRKLLFMNRYKVGSQRKMNSKYLSVTNQKN